MATYKNSQYNYLYVDNNQLIPLYKDLFLRAEMTVENIIQSKNTI